MKTKLFKNSKKIAIILFAVFNIAGIIACGNSDITGSGEISSSADGGKKGINTSLPTWGKGYKPDLSGPEPAFYHVIRYTASGSSKLDKATMNYISRTDNLQVYVEKGYNYNSANVNQVVQKFEDNYRQMINIYGAHTDMDKNGRIKLFFVKINENSNSDVLATGYFYPNDLIYGSGNNGEILYMDINLLNSKPNEIAGTVLHEFQHLINFNVNFLRKGKEMSLWLDECLSESTSILFDSSVVQSRIKEFNQIDYYCFYTWYLPYPYQNYFVNYPSASMFMNWLYIKNGRNSNIFKRIASSTQNEDYNKVLYTVSGYSSWGNLLKDWINGVRIGTVSGASIRTRSYSTLLYPGAVIYDGSQVRVNDSKELSSNPGYITVRGNSTLTLGRSILNNNNSNNNENNNDEEEIILQEIKNIEEMQNNNSETKYIDLSFDRNGKIRKY